MLVEHCSRTFQTVTTYQVVCHGVDVSGDFLPSALETSHICLTAKYAFDSDVSGDTLHLIAEAVKSVHHVIDGILENEYLPPGFDVDLPAHVAVGNGLCDTGDTAHLSELAGTTAAERTGVDRKHSFLPGL